MKLIVGLGNPGKKYAGTRHNVGFEVVDRLAARWGVDLRTEKFHGFFGAGSFSGERVVLVKPLTFMNLSGQAVAAVGKFYKLELDDLLVIVDDLALPVGTTGCKILVIGSARVIGAGFGSALASPSVTRLVGCSDVFTSRSCRR